MLELTTKRSFSGETTNNSLLNFTPTLKFLNKRLAFLELLDTGVDLKQITGPEGRTWWIINNHSCQFSDLEGEASIKHSDAFLLYLDLIFGL